MQIKVCGLTDKDNIAEVLSLQPDYIGFIFYKGSKRYIGNSTDLADYIASVNTAKKTGVFVNASKDTIIKTIARYKLNVVQLHGTESPETCRQLNKYIEVIKAFHIDKQFDFGITKQYISSCNYFLFDTASADYGGTGHTFNWSLLNAYTLSTPFFLSGGIGPEHAPSLKRINNKALFAIDINSRFETSPGIKNIDLLKTFMHEIRN